MTATLIQSPDRIILRNISWQTYRSLITDFEAEPAMRLTYDRGTLEIRMQRCNLDCIALAQRNRDC
jgi:hypothetical protein